MASSSSEAAIFYEMLRLFSLEMGKNDSERFVVCILRKETLTSWIAVLLFPVGFHTTQLQYSHVNNTIKLCLIQDSHLRSLLQGIKVPSIISIIEYF